MARLAQGQQRRSGRGRRPQNGLHGLEAPPAHLLGDTLENRFDQPNLEPK